MRIEKTTWIERIVCTNDFEDLGGVDAVIDAVRPEYAPRTRRCSSA